MTTTFKFPLLVFNLQGQARAKTDKGAVFKKVSVEPPLLSPISLNKKSIAFYILHFAAVSA